MRRLKDKGRVSPPTTRGPDCVVSYDCLTSGGLLHRPFFFHRWNGPAEQEDNRFQRTRMADIEQRRPNPEHLLQQVEDEESRASRGRLKIFLGYAGGVGKSFR